MTFVTRIHTFSKVMTFVRTTGGSLSGRTDGGLGTCGGLDTTPPALTGTSRVGESLVASTPIPSFGVRLTICVPASCILSCSGPGVTDWPLPMRGELPVNGSTTPPLLGNIHFGSFCFRFFKGGGLAEEMSPSPVWEFLLETGFFCNAARCLAFFNFWLHQKKNLVFFP